MAITPIADLVATVDGDDIDLTWTNEDIYDTLRVWKDSGSGFSLLEGIGNDDTSYTDESVTVNTRHSYKIRMRISGETSVWSNTDSAGIWRNIPTATVYVGGTIGESVVGTDYTDTLTGTINISGIILDAQTLKTTYAYYVGDSNGKIYQYSAAYLGDAGSNISARWESKDTDFADQNMEWADKFKTIEKVRLHYIDKTSDATVSLLVSTDGGATWDSKTRSIGTGDGKGKTADFFLIKTGQIFRFTIENASASDDFQFVGLEISYSVGGDYFEI